jgi:hypothetical protein
MSPPIPESLPVQQSIDVNTGRAFNQWTRLFNDSCSYQNQTRVSSKPMKYYVNQYNSPQTNPFETFSVIGNQKVYNIPNVYDRALPTRLNSIGQVYILPYNTTPYLANAASDRSHIDTGSYLRWGTEIRPKQSETSLGEVDYNRWSPGVKEETVQNAGQFAVGMKMQQPIGKDGYYDYTSQNNVLFGNSAVPGIQGISSRNQLRNFIEVNKC